jgi:hypothetical protein
MRAKEREIDDRRRIFKKAYQRLKIRRVVTPPESATSLIKLVISGNDYAVKAHINDFS